VDSSSTDASDISQEGNHELHENVAGEPTGNYDVDLTSSHGHSRTPLQWPTPHGQLRGSVPR